MELACRRTPVTWYFALLLFTFPSARLISWHLLLDTCYFSSGPFPFPMADPKILETFPNPAPQRDYLIEHTHHEFTSVGRMPGPPDFADITVSYVANKKCVELKSLKLYFHAYRNEGIFFEAA